MSTSFDQSLQFNAAGETISIVATTAIFGGESVLTELDVVHFTEHGVYAQRDSIETLYFVPWSGVSYLVQSTV